MLEGLAIVTALVLILVDYKLKNDLVDLFKRMEAALEDGRKLLGPQFAANVDLDSVRPGNMVGNASPVETSASNGSAEGLGLTHKTAPPKRETTVRARRTRGTPVPRPDNPVGS